MILLVKLITISTLLLLTSIPPSRSVIRNYRNYIRPQKIHHLTLPIVEYYRVGRSVVIKVTETITNGALYSIRNVGDGLHLTAKSGRNKPGPVVTKHWKDTPSQMFEINKLETSSGYSLKPLHNEFNSITSQLTKNTHSYHAWEFNKARQGYWMIHDIVEDKCIKSNGNTQAVTTEICNPNNPSQLWMFNKIE